MALATTCPACSTSFKVNPEQLKLRRGLVRCGKCDHVFSGVEYLRYVSDARTDEELNEDQEGDDRRRRDRRGTGRRLWGNEEPSATDELKTAFFLPDTELGPGESATEGLGNEALKTSRNLGKDKPARNKPAKTSEQAKQSQAAQEASDNDPDSPPEESASAGEASDSAEDASGKTKADKSGEDQNDTDDSASDAEQPATGKRTRRGSARGKRGRGRRKRAAARTQAEQDADKGEETAKGDSKAAGAGDAKQASDATDTSKKAQTPDAADAADTPEIAAGPSKNADVESEQSAQPEPDSKAESPKPSPFSSRSQTRAGAVITSPLTKGARGDFQKAGRDEDWSTAPVWPQIDENFDEPDIEEPDSRPGPVSAENIEAKASQEPAKRSASKRADADSVALSSADDLPIADGDPHEEDAIDFFGKTSRPSFDFDLPPRQVLIVAAGLVLLLLVQLAIGNRDVLASKYPSIGSGLAAISAPFGLKVQLPMNREEIKIASFDLTAASSREPDASYVMNLLMRNNARHKLRWPAIELTLLDGVGGILVRKVLMPAEYLPDESLITTGLAGSSEQPIRVALKSSTDAPVGYSVSLFYP